MSGKQARTNNAKVSGRRLAKPRRVPRGFLQQLTSNRNTDGKSIQPVIDQRVFWVRRYRKLVSQHAAELGGLDQISSSELALIERAATLRVALEHRDAQFAEAGQASDNQLYYYQQCSNTLRRLLSTLGLQRRSRDVTPSVDAFLASEGYRRDDVVEAE